METSSAVLSGLSLKGMGKNSYTIEISKGSLKITDCDISSDFFSSIGAFGPTAVPQIYRCRINKAKEHGLHFTVQAQGLIRRM